MSLEVTLYFESERVRPCETCGHVQAFKDKEELFTAEITHNLGEMAQEANLYSYLWTPELMGIKTSGELIPHLTKGLELLRSNPPKFEKFNSPNGWGKYEDLVNFVTKYLDACRQYPKATVETCR